MSYEKGIREIQNMVENGPLPKPAAVKGSVKEINFSEEYGKSILKHVNFSHKPKIVVDYGNYCYFLLEW